MSRANNKTLPHLCARGSAIVFVVLHGLHGNGLSLYEFAELLAAREVDGGAGCHIALNLDGGPSTQVAMNLT
jgi:Phosphodiester glycosidase